MLTQKIKSFKINIREKFNPYLGPLRLKRLIRLTGDSFLPFTIISNNCWAGHVYRYYNLPYTSPTIGLFFFSEDFLKFTYDLKGYLSLKFNFITYKESKYRKQLEEYGGGCLSCPIGVLGDIEVIFLHYKTTKEAMDKWDRRKDRINWDNIYFKMSEMNLCSPSLLTKFDQLPSSKKVVFTTKDYKLSSQIIFTDSYMKDYISDDTTNFRKYINLDAFIAGKLIKP